MTPTFGTAGIRGRMPDEFNLDVVVHTTAGVAAWLQGKCLGGGTVVVGHDARHNSAEFARAAAEVLAAEGFSVVLLPRALPTPITAFAVKALRAVAGVQLTASHNPPADNGLKVYVSDGAQLVSPADREIEAAIARVGAVRRVPVGVADTDLVSRYLARITQLPKGTARELRIAVTAMHGVGGELLVAALRAVGFTDVHVVAEQFEPDPDFPTTPFPNPEEPGATDLLLALAERVDADLAIALDPDADRCALGVGGRMLRGDETGVLVGDYVMAPGGLVATTVVSSRLLGKVAAARGARFAETLTGFKWLTRAGDGLVYAYEEALGLCVDPDHVRDKDGISAAVLAADLAATLKAQGRTLLDVLDDYAVEFGLHATGQRSVIGADPMPALRAAPPAALAGAPVTVTDLLTERGRMHTDAMIFEGATVRVVVRPSGTEPKVKCYAEVIEPVADHADLPRARTTAAARLEAALNDITRV